MINDYDNNTPCFPPFAFQTIKQQNQIFVKVAFHCKNVKYVPQFYELESTYVKFKGCQVQVSHILPGHHLGPKPTTSPLKTV